LPAQQRRKAWKNFLQKRQVNAKFLKQANAIFGLNAHGSLKILSLPHQNLHIFVSAHNFSLIIPLTQLALNHQY
jgi:hypothetical protein